MNTSHPKLAATLLAGLLALVCAPAGATGVSTNLYSATSTSEDVAESCTNVTIASSTGVVSASCNKDTDGTVGVNSTTIDLDDVLYCLVNTDPDYPVVLAWGTTTSHYTPADWSVSVSSNGYDYHAFATCKRGGDTNEPQSGVSISDTVKGLKNDDGELEGR